MSNQTEKPQWMQDETVREIPEEKLQFLEEAFKSLQGKSQKEAMATLLPLLKRAKKDNLSLTGNEMQVAITAIKKYSSEKELEKINSILEQQLNSTK